MSDNVKETDRTNCFELKTPVFLNNSFILPVFNETFSKELLNVLDWISHHISDNQLICDLNLIVFEIIQINQKLLQKYDFDKFTEKYSEKCISSLFIRKEFSDININAKFNFIENYANDLFLTGNNEVCIGFIRRKIENHWKIAEDCESCSKFMFMDRFLLELSRATRLIKENITNM